MCFCCIGCLFAPSYSRHAWAEPQNRFFLCRQGVRPRFCPEVQFIETLRKEKVRPQSSTIRPDLSRSRSSFSLSLSLFLSLSFSLTLFHSLALSHTHKHANTCTHTCTHTNTWPQTHTADFQPYQGAPPVNSTTPSPRVFASELIDLASSLYSEQCTRGLSFACASSDTSIGIQRRITFITLLTSYAGPS